MDDSKITDIMLAALRAEGLSEQKAVAAVARFWQMITAQKLFQRRDHV